MSFNPEPGTWIPRRGYVMSTCPIDGSWNDPDNAFHYEGYMICESVRTPEIASLIAALPDLLAAAKNLENDDGAIPDHAWQPLQAAIAKAEGNADAKI